MPLIETTPILTVYRSGWVNLNLEATLLMHAGHGFADLLPPATRRHGWQLDRRAGTTCALVPGGDSARKTLRFRAPYRADALFARHPPEVKRLRFRITPHEQFLDLYTLAAELPIPSGHSAH